MTSANAGFERAEALAGEAAEDICSTLASVTAA